MGDMVGFGATRPSAPIDDSGACPSKVMLKGSEIMLAAQIRICSTLVRLFASNRIEASTDAADNVTSKLLRSTPNRISTSTLTASTITVWLMSSSDPANVT